MITWDLGGSCPFFGGAKSSNLQTEYFLPFLFSEPIPTQLHFLCIPPPYFKATAEQFLESMKKTLFFLTLFLPRWSPA